GWSLESVAHSIARSAGCRVTADAMPRPTGSSSVAASAAAIPAKAPAKKQSSENQSSPKPSSSARRAVRTMPSGGMWLPSTAPTGGRSAPGLAELGGGGHDGLDDLAVAGAAAEVARQREANVVLRRIGPLREQRRCRHEHARSAEAALDPAALDECALERAGLTALREPLDGDHLPPVGLQREERAR